MMLGFPLTVQDMPSAHSENSVALGSGITPSTSRMGGKAESTNPQVKITSPSSSILGSSGAGRNIFFAASRLETVKSKLMKF